MTVQEAISIYKLKFENYVAIYDVGSVFLFIPKKSYMGRFFPAVDKVRAALISYDFVENYESFEKAAEVTPQINHSAIVIDESRYISFKDFLTENDERLSKNKEAQQ